MTAHLPSGTVTFLFTDIEGSTQLWEQHPDAMRAALARHDTLLRAAVDANHGQVIKSTGDGLHAVFAAAAEAARAVVAGQRALRAEPWPGTGPLRVRMALHTGEADLRDGDYYGPALNRAARLMAVAAGGQSLVSQTTAAIIQDRLPPQVDLHDLGEHCLKDLVRPERVFQLVAPDLPAEFPRLRSLNAFPHNLPVQLTSFVGRESEIAEARRLLSDTHLLTLTGPGGTGKTRLALQMAAEVLPEYADGAWLVELAPLADPAYLVPALAAVFDVRESAGRPLLAAVTDYLRAKHLLLLLDNCEHLIEACARLADALLHACPGLKLLASSREALGLAGETAYRVPSLALPDPRTATPDSLARSEAARLFVERARAAQPRFALTAGNAPAVAAICRRLDGIPLALELAAARVRVLPAEQILARLDDRFRLLVGGSRTALPRQQTLRALIDWSYDLLPDDERRLLRALSVFAGGATLEAAEAVGEGQDVLDLLTQLVNKSLVAVDDPAYAGSDGPTARYRLLETIRQYAREKLLDEKGGDNPRNPALALPARQLAAASGGQVGQVSQGAGAAAARDRHLAFFLRLIEAAEPKLIGAELIAALDELEAEQDNFRAALEWALDHDPLSAARLVAVLWFFFASRGSAAEGRQWVAAALARADTLRDPALALPARRLATASGGQVGQESQGAGHAPGAAEPASLPSSVAALARVWAAEAALALQLGDNPAALAAAKTSMALARQVDAPRTLTLALGIGATLAGRAGEMDVARAWADECLALARRHNFGFELGLYAGAPMFLGAMSNPAAVPDLRAEMLAAARASRSPWAIATAMQNAARVSMMIGDYAAAQQGFEESAALFRQIGDRHSENASRSERGHGLRRQGRHAEAKAVYAETVRVWQTLGERAALAHELECLAFIEGATGQAERAATLFGSAEALRERIGSTMSILERPEYDQAVAQLRAQTEAGALNAAWASGRALALDEAVRLALADGGERPYGSRDAVAARVSLTGGNDDRDSLSTPTQA